MRGRDGEHYARDHARHARRAAGEHWCEHLPLEGSREFIAAGDVMNDGADPIMHNNSRDTRVPVASIDDSLGTKLLPFVLSVIAGSVNVISFVGLGGLFTAHITGNLAILAAHHVSGSDAPLAVMLSVPVFMVVLGLTRLLVGGLEAIGFASLRPLLLLQFLLLAGFLVLCVSAGPCLNPNSAIAIVAGMLGVAAMAVQNALPQISLTGAPSRR